MMAVLEKFLSLMGLTLQDLEVLDWTDKGEVLRDEVPRARIIHLQPLFADVRPWLAACHTNPPCPDPKVCGAWSSLVNCDSRFCDSHVDCDFITDGVAIVQLKERFRVCTLADGSQCLDWQLWSYKVRCGC